MSLATNNIFSHNTSVLAFDLKKDPNRIRKMVFYGRVSTEHEAQISALENQMKWYDDQLKYHPNWDVVDRYIDEGITGTQAKKRPAFLKMIEDARAGKFDLIVTREVCRFARNTVDTLVTTRELKNIGVEVYFVEDNIWTLDGDGELRLTIMATLAQEESRKVSERVRAGQHISRTKGVVYGTGNIMGYDRVGGTYVINEEQAEIVRLIYRLYLEGEMGLTKIADKLNQMGLKNASGLVKWSQSNVGRILSNPTYMGVMAYGKSYTNNYLEQKRINNHNRDTYMYVKSDFPAIVSEEDWRAVEKIRRARSFNIPEKNHVDPVLGVVEYRHPKNAPKAKWTAKLKCACGSAMRRNKWHTNKKVGPSYGFCCYGQYNKGSAKKRIKLGLDPTGFCDVPETAEWKLDFICLNILREIFTDSMQRKVIIEALGILEECYDDEDRKALCNGAVQREIGRIQAKINNLIELYTEGEVSKADYRARRDRLNNELSEAKSKLEEVNEEKAENAPDKRSEIEMIRKTLRKRIKLEDNIVSKEIVDAFIGRVIIQRNRNYTWYINMSGIDDDRIDKYIKEHEPVFKYEREFTFEQAKAWRLQNGDFLRKSQWTDVTAEIIII